MFVLKKEKGKNWVLVTNCLGFSLLSIHIRLPTRTGLVIDGPTPLERGYNRGAVPISSP